MATTSGSQRSAGNFSYRKLLDFCCDREAQRNCFWLLRCLRFVFPALAVLTATVLLLLHFAVSPRVKAYVEDARLDSFNSVAPNNNNNNNTPPTKSGPGGFAYNISISVALTVRNLNGAMDIEYTKPLVAAFLFDDRRLYNVTVADKGHRQRPLKREAHLLVHTGGEAPYCVLDAAAVAEFEKQNATGLLQLEMRLSGEITIGIRSTRKVSLSCPLTLRRPPPGPDIVDFHEVACEPDKPKKIVF